MAELISVVKRHDTWPPVKGKATDVNGALMELAEADSLKFIAKSGVTTITGSAVAIEPPEEGFNWKYVWAEGDTSVVGTYKVELEITWDSGSSPHKVQTVPNSGTVALEIQEDQG